MNISSGLSRRITELIQDYVTDAAPDTNNLRRLAAENVVLPLLTDWGGVLAISPGGEVISFPFGADAGSNAAPSSGDTGRPTIETDPRIRNLALFQGSKKYPELKELIVKPADARVCPSCGGTGVEPNAASHNLSNVVCYCGGLGWVPSE
jgi:hypothetical protein